MAVKFSDILKGIGKYATYEGRNLSQNLQNMILAGQVKRVRPEDYTNISDYKKALAESNKAYRTLQSELVSPTMNERTGLNKFLGITPEEQKKQTGAQLYGYSKETPQGMLISPEIAKMTASMISKAPVGANSLLGTLALGGARGAAGGFSSSVPGSELTDTLIGIPFGMATEGLSYGMGKLGKSLKAKTTPAKPASDAYTKSLNLNQSTIDDLGGWPKAKEFAAEFAGDAKKYGFNISDRYSKAEALPQIKNIVSKDVGKALLKSPKGISANEILSNLSSNQAMKYLMTKDPKTVNYVLQMIADSADENGVISAVGLKGVIDNIQDIGGGFKNVTGDQSAVAKQIFSTARDELRNQLDVAAPEASDLLGKWSRYIKASPAIESKAVTGTKEFSAPLVGKLGGTATTKASDWLTNLLSSKGSAGGTTNPTIAKGLLETIGLTRPGGLAGAVSTTQMPTQTTQEQAQALGENDPGLQAIRAAFGQGTTGTMGTTPATGTTQTDQIKQILAMGVLSGDISGSDASTLMDLLGLSATTTGSKLPASALTDLSNTQEALNLLPQLTGLLEEGASAFGPLEGPVRGAIPWDKTGQKAKSTITLIKQIIGKGLEGGVLRKEDEYKYEQILPKLGDTQDTVRTKIELLNQTLNNKYNTLVSTYEAGGYNPYYGQ